MIHFRIKKDEDFDRENKTGTPHEYYTYGVVCTEVEIDVLYVRCGLYRGRN